MGRALGFSGPIEARHVLALLRQRGWASACVQRAEEVVRIRNNVRHFAGLAFGRGRAERDVLYIAGSLEFLGDRQMAGRVRGLVSGERKRHGGSGVRSGVGRVVVAIFLLGVLVGVFLSVVNAPGVLVQAGVVAAWLLGGFVLVRHYLHDVAITCILCNFLRGNQQTVGDVAEASERRGPRMERQTGDPLGRGRGRSRSGGGAVRRSSRQPRRFIHIAMIWDLGYTLCGLSIEGLKVGPPLEATCPDCLAEHDL